MPTVTVFCELISINEVKTFLSIQVHLMVAVVGRLFQKWFPAQPNLSYTFIWDKTDAYGQRVYGLSEAVGKFVQIENTVFPKIQAVLGICYKV